MKAIQLVVKNAEWQTLRKGMIGTWKENPNRNLRRLKEYLGASTNSDKLRRVHNYLGSLRGIHNTDIVRYRMQIKEKRRRLGQI